MCWSWDPFEKKQHESIRNYHVHVFVNGARPLWSGLQQLHGQSHVLQSSACGNVASAAEPGSSNSAPWHCPASPADREPVTTQAVKTRSFLLQLLLLHVGVGTFGFWQQRPHLWEQFHFNLAEDVWCIMQDADAGPNVAFYFKLAYRIRETIYRAA